MSDQKMNPWEDPELSPEERAELIGDHHEQDHRDETGSYGECPGFSGYSLARDVEEAINAAILRERQRCHKVVAEAAHTAFVNGFRQLTRSLDNIADRITGGTP